MTPTNASWAEWNAERRQHVFWGVHLKIRTTRSYLQGVKSAAMRARVRATCRVRLGGRWQGMNARIRAALHDSVFEVLDEQESKSGGRSDHPNVVQLGIVLNLLADDLGWNDEGVTP